MARPRRALHRAFARWLEANSSLLPVSVRFTKRTDRVWSFAFVGVTEILSGWINTFEISVAAEWDGGAWDLILDLDAYPVRVSGGFACRVCEPEKRVVFPSLEGLWADHLFEPFLAWVNDELAVLPWLELMGTVDTAMCARLRPEAGVPRPAMADRWPVRYVPVRAEEPSAYPYTMAPGRKWRPAPKRATLALDSIFPSPP